MTFLRTSFLLIFCSLGLIACATAPVADMQPGEKPAIDTDEAGLWMYMDKAESNLRTSGRIVTDEQLNTQVAEIICKLAPNQCSHMRFYIVETPHFNASMAPNGFMQIWTGLMLRSQNEDQFAYVLGHEIGHYNRRHTLQQWRRTKNTTTGLAVFQLLTAGAGIGVAGQIAYIAGLAGLMAYSRDMEREADDIGFDLMLAAGYDPREAPKIWRNLMEEMEAADDSMPSIFFASHPSTSERVSTLEKRAQAAVSSSPDLIPSREPYLDMIAPFRGEWLHDELQKRDFAGTQVVLKHLFDQNKNPGELYYYQGELYRMRGESDDMEKAITAYQSALQQEGFPSETYRSLGLLFWKSKRMDPARDAFQNYLDASPGAHDAPMIEAYLEELAKNEN